MVIFVYTGVRKNIFLVGRIVIFNKIRVFIVRRRGEIDFGRIIGSLCIGFSDN